MNSPSHIIDSIFQDATDKDIRLWVSRGDVYYQAERPIPRVLSRLIEKHKDAIIVRLRTWNSGEAARLESAADNAVAVTACGADRVIQDLVATCDLARRSRDLAGVREACRRIEERARELRVRAAMEPCGVKLPTCRAPEA